MNENIGILEQIQGQDAPLFIEAFRAGEHMPALSSSEQFLQAAANGAGHLVEAIYSPYVPVHFHDKPRKIVGRLSQEEIIDLQKNPGYHIWSSPDGAGFEMIGVFGSDTSFFVNLSSVRGTLSDESDTQAHYRPLTEIVERLNLDINRQIFKPKLSKILPEVDVQSVFDEFVTRENGRAPRNRQIDLRSIFTSAIRDSLYTRYSGQLEPIAQDMIPMLPEHWYSFFSIFDATGNVSDKSLYLLALDEHTQTFTVVGLDHGKLLHTTADTTSGAPFRRFYLIPPSLYPGAIVHDAYTSALRVQPLESGKVVKGLSGAPVTYNDLQPQLIELF